MKLSFVTPGKWAIKGGAYDGMYAVRVSNNPVVWEIQNEQGNLMFNDGFESLNHIRSI